MKNIVTITLKLLVITVFAGAILGLVNAVTKEPIAQQKRAQANEARFAAFPEAADFAGTGGAIPEKYAIIKDVYTALDADGNAIGITAAVVTKGFNPGLNLMVGVGADGVIKGVVVNAHAETPGLGDKAATPGFQSQFTGKPADQPLTVVKTQPSRDSDIQAITSATITTTGVTDAVNTVIAYYQETAGGAQ